MLTHFDIGNESLGFQGNDFFQALIFEIGRVQRMKAMQVAQLGEMASAIEKLSAKYLNANVRVTWRSRGGPGSVYTRVNTRSHAMFSRVQRSIEGGYFWNVNRTEDALQKIGFVDPAKGKLGGDYATQRVEMILNSETFLNGDPEFLADVVLHENGHIYANAFFDGVFTVRSMALDWAYKEMMGASDKELVKKIIIQARKAAGLPPSKVVQAAEGEDRIKTFTIMAADMTREIMENDPLELYHYDRAEQMADAYVLRHGGGKSTFTARHQAYRNQRQAAFKKGYQIGASLIVGGIMTLVSAPVGLIILLGTSFTGLATSLSGNKAPSARQVMGALINERIQIIKEGDVPEKLLKEMVAEIESAQKVYESEVSQEVENASTFSGFFTRLVGDKNVSRDFNDRLEDLSTNRLFLAAAKLAN